MSRRPSLYISHGEPTFAPEAGAAGAQRSAPGREVGRPAAVPVGRAILHRSTCRALPASTGRARG